MSIGKTPKVNQSALEKLVYAATPEEAFNNTLFSKASYSLKAGIHKITINVADSINKSGTGAVRLVKKMQPLHNLSRRNDEDDDGEEDGDEAYYDVFNINGMNDNNDDSSNGNEGRSSGDDFSDFLDDFNSNRNINVNQNGNGGQDDDDFSDFFDEYNIGGNKYFFNEFCKEYNDDGGNLGAISGVRT